MFEFLLHIVFGCFCLRYLRQPVEEVERKDSLVCVIRLDCPPSKAVKK